MGEAVKNRRRLISGHEADSTGRLRRGVAVTKKK